MQKLSKEQVKQLYYEESNKFELKEVELTPKRLEYIELAAGRVDQILASLKKVLGGNENHKDAYILEYYDNMLKNIKLNLARLISFCKAHGSPKEGGSASMEIAFSLHSLRTLHLNLKKHKDSEIHKNALDVKIPATRAKGKSKRAFKRNKTSTSLGRQIGNVCYLFNKFFEENGILTKNEKKTLSIPAPANPGVGEGAGEVELVDVLPDDSDSLNLGRLLDTLTQFKQKYSTSLKDGGEGDEPEGYVTAVPQGLQNQLEKSKNREKSASEGNSDLVTLEGTEGGVAVACAGIDRQTFLTASSDGKVKEYHQKKLIFLLKCKKRVYTDVGYLNYFYYLSCIKTETIYRKKAKNRDKGSLQPWRTFKSANIFSRVIETLDTSNHCVIAFNGLNGVVDVCVEPDVDQESKNLKFEQIRPEVAKNDEIVDFKLTECVVKGGKVMVCVVLLLREGGVHIYGNRPPKSSKEQKSVKFVNLGSYCVDLGSYCLSEVGEGENKLENQKNEKSNSGKNGEDLGQIYQEEEAFSLAARGCLQEVAIVVMSRLITSKKLLKFYFLNYCEVCGNLDENGSYLDHDNPGVDYFHSFSFFPEKDENLPKRRKKGKVQKCGTIGDTRIVGVTAGSPNNLFIFEFSSFRLDRKLYYPGFMEGSVSCFMQFGQTLIVIDSLGNLREVDD